MLRHSPVTICVPKSTVRPYRKTVMDCFGVLEQFVTYTVRGSGKSWLMSILPSIPLSFRDLDQLYIEVVF